MGSHPQSQVDVTSVLAEFVCSVKPEGLPGSVQHQVCRHALDCVGAALTGLEHRAGQIVASLAEEAGGKGEARILGRLSRLPAGQAAWANGAAAHLLDIDDTGFSHPTACILPAALAVAEHRGLRGADLVAAMAVGYEVFDRLSQSGRGNEPALRRRGFHPTGLYGPPAAAAAAGYLLELDATGIHTALGLAVATSGGLSQHFGTWGKGLHAGNAARAGVTCAQLATRGYWGDDRVIEGDYGFFSAFHGSGNYRFDHLSRDLGTRWAIVDPGLSIKSYPACGGVQRAVQATLKLRRQLGITDLADIARIEVEVPADLLDVLRHRAPTEGFRGKFSIDYCIAAAALDGELGHAAFTDQYAQSPAMRSALAKVAVSTSASNASYFSERRTPVRIVARDGRSAQDDARELKGSPQNPLTNVEIAAKYASCAQGQFAPSHVEETIARFVSLPASGEVGELLDYLAVCRA